MNLAHMIGEHSDLNFIQSVLHSIFSWAGLIISLIISLAIGVPIYLNSRRSPARQGENRQ